MATVLRGTALANSYAMTLRGSRAVSKTRKLKILHLNKKSSSSFQLERDRFHMVGELFRHSSLLNVSRKKDNDGTRAYDGDREPDDASNCPVETALLPHEDQ